MATNTTSGVATSGAIAKPGFHMSASGWDACAERYEAEAPYLTAPPARHALAKVMTLLNKPAEEGAKYAFADIACGSGALTTAAALVPTVRSIIASDYSTGMCAIVDRKSASIRVALPSAAEIKTLVADAQDLSAIPSDSVDATFCVFGIMMVPDGEKAYREMVRITKPGGLVTVLTWLEPSSSQFHGVMIAINKNFMATPASTALAPTSTPATATTPPSASSSPPTHNHAIMNLQVPFNTLDQFESIWSKVGLQKEVLETFTAPSRMFDGVVDWLSSMRGVAPMIGDAYKTPESFQRAIDYLSGIFGKNSKFNLHATSIIAIARKPVQ